jgi:hypothetical protein
MKHDTHIPEQELVAYLFGDSAQGPSIEAHVRDCENCSAELAKLRSVLHAINDETVPVPEREQYAEQVWAAVRPRLGEAERPSIFAAWLRPQRLAIAGGVLALIIVAFVAGRFSRPTGQPPQVVQNPATTSPTIDKDRLVRAEVGSHLERSQMMLVELSNAESGKDGADISAEQERARDLLEANRLYRQSAKRAGDPAIGAVLDELERVLLEIANSPSELSKQRLAELQQQIEDQDLLFKVRVIESKVRSSNKRESAQQTDPTQRRL